MAVTSNPRGPADKESVADFVAGVGARVRQARKSRAISRRILAERSGVSQRYLAQLEAGAGNISIGLLFQVASALEVEPQDLLANPTELADDWRHIAILFGKASVEQQVRALAQLEPAHQHIGKANRICLIGLRGAGKSTLGQRLAIELKMEFVELNRLIEDQAGMPVGLFCNSF